MKELIHEIRDLVQSARRAVVRSVDQIQVLTNFEIGRRIVEHEQGGAERAEYGKALLKELSAALTAEFGRGFSRSNLEYMRKFYLTYQDRAAQIAQTPPAKFLTDEKSQIPSGKSVAARKSQIPSGTFATPFNLSWSQYVFLISIDNPDERSFYEIEAAHGGWTLSELKRQFNSGLYERLALSRDKDGVKKLAAEGQLIARPEDLLKEPYVLIDLKIGKLSHGDLGQMQMYVNYFDRFVKLDEEAPTVGIILCKKKHDALVEITLPRDANIHAKEYQLYLPDKELLRKKLTEWGEEVGG